MNKPSIFNPCFSIRRLLAVSVLFLIGLQALAQQTVVKGVITDDSGQPVIGAAVVEKGTHNGNITDVDGKYSLTASSPNVTLEISCLGMISTEVAIQGRNTVNVTLQQESTALDGVVVTALGVKRDEKALGYAVSAVGAEELTAGREENVMSAIIGKVAGVDITTTTAGPTGSTRVLIRGNSQLSGSNLPLYVVDGIPVDNTTIGSEPGKWGGYDYGDVLSSINPSDIESITVLKGPSASALYGSQASNGVVMITTKSAQKNKRLGVELSSSVSVVNVLTKFDDYQRVYGMGRNGDAPYDLTTATGVSQSAWGGKLDPNLQTYIYNGEMKDYGNKNNNVLSFFQTGVTYNNSVSLSHSSDKNSFRFSLSDMRGNDIVPNSTMSKTSLSLRAMQKFGKSIKIEASASYTMEKVNNRPALGDAANNIGNSIIGLAPNFDQAWLAANYKDENGNYYDWNGNSYRFNPYWVINEMQNKSSKNRLIGQAKFTWQIYKDLKFSLRGGLDTYNFSAMEYTPISTPRDVTGAIATRSTTMMQSNLEAMLTYSKKIGRFDISAFAGGNIMNYSNDINYVSGTNHVSTDVIDISGFENKEIEHSLRRKEIRSLYAQASFGFDETYYIDATVRNDVSSTLAPGNRSYWYPSVSGSLIFSNLFNHGSWLSFAKLRASWALVGGDTDPYRLDLLYGLREFTLNGSSLGTAARTSSIPNYNIQPTSTNSGEIGLDTRFFNDRLSLDLTLYMQNTKNQIMSMPVSLATGRKTALINAGEIENKGIELTLGGVPVRAGGFEWEINGTYSHNVNMVKSLHEMVPDYELAAARWANAFIYARAGEPYGAIVGRKILRAPDGQMLLNEAGMPQFEEEVSVLGNGNYDHIVGLTNTFSWKGLKLSVVFDAKFGADVYSMSTMQSYANGTATATLEGREGWYQSEQLRKSEKVNTNDWTPTGGFLAPGVKLGPVVDGVQTYVPNDTYVNPQLYWQEFQNNSPEPFIIDASYIKLREMSLSWTLPSKWTNRLHLESVALSVYGRNLAILYSNLKNIDPESTYNNGNGKGFEYGSLPSRRTFGFGLNIKF